MSGPTVKLNSGHEMPLVGFGLWKVSNDTCADTVYNAIKAGYRLLDGACGTYLLTTQHATRTPRNHPPRNNLGLALACVGPVGPHSCPGPALGEQLSLGARLSCLPFPHPPSRDESLYPRLARLPLLLLLLCPSPHYDVARFQPLLHSPGSNKPGRADNGVDGFRGASSQPRHAC